MINYSYNLDRRRASDATATHSSTECRLDGTYLFRIQAFDSSAPDCGVSGLPHPETIQISANEVLSDYPRRSHGATANENDIPAAGLDILFMNDKVYPFLHCGSVAVKQNANATQEFEATCAYRSPPFSQTTIEQLGGIGIPADLNSYPVIYQTEQRLVDYVLYEDKTPAPTGPLQCKLPTGNLFSQPFVEKVPNETVVVTQYEASMSAEIAASRLETVNSIQWIYSGDDNQWKITDIDWQQVRIIVGSALVEDSFLVRYTVQRLDKTAGWRSKRALLDTHYLQTGGNESTRQPFTNKEGGRTNWIGQIDINGIPSPTVLQYQTYIVQPEMDFTTFLRPENP